MPRLPRATPVAARIRVSHLRGNSGVVHRAGLWMCGSCGHQTSVTAGTLFQDTRTSLVTWFRAVWWVVSQKNGASALGLQRVLGLGSYRTAWTWLHKLRRAMVRLGRDRFVRGGRGGRNLRRWG